MQGKWLLAAGVLIVMGAGAGLWTWYREGQQPSQGPAASTQLSEVAAEIAGSGQIRAQQVESIASPVEGNVEALLVEVGQQVFAGQQLASIRSASTMGFRDLAAREAEEAQSRASTIETQMLAARLEAARARAAAAQARDTYERAEREYKRQEMLHREGATPRLTFEKAQTQFQQAESEFRSVEALAQQADDRLASLGRDLETARRTVQERQQVLEDANEHVAAGDVFAEWDGIVASIGVAVGDHVSPEDPEFIQIATTLAVLEVLVELPPPDLKRLQPGDEALVSIQEVPSAALTARVSEVRDDAAVVEFQNPSPEVKPGMNARVQLRPTR